MATLSVHLVTWNGAKYIPFLFESLRKQTFKDWELLVIDNGSTDGTVEAIKKEQASLTIPVQIIQNERNIGFAGGHNQAVRTTKGEYIQLLNQDMYLVPDYFEKVVAMMEARPEAGAGQGALLKWGFSKFPISNCQFSIVETLTDIVDTMGLKVTRNRRVVDWRTGEHNAPQPPLNLRGGVIEVFGVSGALPIYRRKAVEAIMFEGQMFDEDFFMYKEDVDLAFRLRSAGWKAYLEPQAQAWHDRTAAGPQKTTDRAVINNRKTKSAFVNYHSYKNHLMVLLKNEHPANLVKDWPWIIWYEFKKFIYLLIFDHATLKGLREVKKLWPRTMQKRAIVMKNYKSNLQEIRQWYV